MYVATHDAVSRVVSGAFGKSSGRPPWYLVPEGKILGLTGAALEADVDSWALAFPGRVTDRVN